jgi:hypothetical protein
VLIDKPAVVVTGPAERYAGIEHQRCQALLLDNGITVYLNTEVYFIITQEEERLGKLSHETDLYSLATLS